MRFGLCPNCESNVDVGGQPEIGNHLICKTCLIESVIVWLNPIELLIMDHEDCELFDDDIRISKNTKNQIKKGENDAPRKTQKEQ
ncbi:MAG: hypothetical protein WBB69_08085 [Anaerolineales bacterium]